MGKQVKGWTPPEDAVEVSEQPQPAKSAWTPPSDAIEVKKKDGTQPSLAQSNGSSGTGFLGTLGAAYDDLVKSYNTKAPEGVQQQPTPIRNAIQRGLNLGSMAEIISPFSSEKPEQEKLQQLAALQKETQELPASPAYDKFNQSKTVKESLSSLAENPVQIIGELTVESLAGLANYGASRMAVGAGSGAVMGSVVPGIGTLSGAGSGVIAGLADTSLALEFTGSFIESLQEAGIDVTDPKQLGKAFEDDELISKARSHAYKKGVPIAIFDLISGGIAGKIASRPAKSLVTKIALGAGEFGAQGALGGAGELAGQLTAGENVNPSAIIAEIIGELGTTPIEVSSNLLGRTKTLVDKANQEPDTTQSPTPEAPQPTQQPETVAGEPTATKQQSDETASDQTVNQSGESQGEKVTEQTGEAGVSPVTTDQPPTIEPAVIAELAKEEVKARRSAIKETIHAIAKEAGIDIDSKEFKALSKQITGKSHLDKMNTDNLARMLDFVQGEKEFSEGTNQLNQLLEEETLNKQVNEKEKEKGLLNQPKTGEQKVGSPVKKLSPVSDDVKEVIRAYDTEARSPSVSEVEKKIAEELINTKLSGESVNRFGDRTQVTPSMAKQYIVGKGKGATLDQVAATVSKSIGKEVSPEQVWDFMNKFPQGPRTISTPSGNALLKELSDKYSDLTGKSINKKIARDMMARPGFYQGIADSIENSGLEEYQRNALESTIYESGLDEVSLENEDQVLDDIVNDYTINGKVDWKKLQADIDDVLGTDNKKITQLTNELYGKLKERTQQGIQQSDSQSDVVEQGQGVGQKGLAERIRSQVSSLRSARTREEKVKIAKQILKDTGTYLLNREGVITGSDASFADKNSPTFFDLIDEGKSVYLMDKTSKIAETEEDYKKINSKLKDKATIINGSFIFDEAFSTGAIEAAKKLGYDAIRLTEIDGTNSTLQILNFDKLEHISGKDFVADIQKSKNEKANDLLADGFSELAEVVGAKKNITGSNAKLNAALVKIGKGLILKGEATLATVVDKLKEFLKSKGVTVSDEDLKTIKAEIKKQTAKKKKPKKRSKPGARKKALFQHLELAKQEIINAFGENYIPQSNEETKKLTDDFIKKMGGIDKAFAAKDLVHPAVKAILYAEKLDSLRSEMDTNKDAMAEYMQLMDELQVITKEGGQAIQILDYIYQNYGMMFTAENQIKKFKEANNGHIPAEIATKFKELEKKHEELEEKVKKLSAEKDEMQGKIDMLNIKQANKREGNIRKQKAQEMIRDAQEERSKLWKELTKLSSARAEIVPVTAISYGVKIANTYIKEGFARGVIGIDEVLEKTNAFWKKATGKDLTKEELDGIKKEIEPTFTFGNIKISHNWIKDLVKQGFDTIEKLVPEVMNELKKEFPEITERQVRDLITGYGKVVNPSKDELNTTIRRIKRLGRIASAIEDLKNKKRPLKSGLQRDKADTEERGMMKEIRELLKEVPVDDVTESTQLKTALDAKKTRLKNRIDDLNAAIKKGKKIENKEQALSDEEIEELTAIRDFNQEIYDNVFKDDKTDQRINRLIKSYETAIEKLRYRIENIGEELVTAKKDKVEDQAVKDIKDRFDNMLKFYNDMREDYGIAELDRLNNLVANAEKVTKKYEEKLANGDYSRRTMKPSYIGAETGVYQAQLDDLKSRLKYAENKSEAEREINTMEKFISKIEELQKAQTERERVRDEFTKEQLKNELENREKWEKALDGFLDAASIPRQLNAGFEFSSVGIQGRTYTLHFLKEDILSAAKQLLTGEKQEYYTKKNFENMFKSWWSQEAHDLNIEKMKSNEAWKRAKQSKLAIHDKDVKMEAREETWTSRVLGTLFDKMALPLKWLGFDKAYKKWTETNISKKFERSAQMYLNAVRFQRYLQLEEKIRKEGKNFISNPDDYKQAASAINTLSGATNVGPFEGKLMKWAPLFFYSFRMLASVLRQVSPLAFVHLAQLHAKGDPKTKLSVAQKAAMSDFAISIGMQAMLMVGFAAMMQASSDDDDDWTVELDPRSSKFMQIRVKGKDGHVTYIDAWGGLRTAIVLQMRLLSGEVKNRNGEIKGLGSRNVPTGEDLVTDYLINKASPLAQPIWYRLARKEKKDKRTGETVYTDKYGNEFAFQNEVAEKLYPMYFNSIYEMKDTQTPEMAAFGALIGLFGVNTNTYDESPKKKH